MRNNGDGRNGAGKGALGTVGILVADRPGDPGFACEGFHRELCSAGARLGLDVVVFTPGGLLSGSAKSMNRGERTARDDFIQAYRPDPAGGWQQVSAHLPDYVYDRHFAASPAELRRYRETLFRLSSIPGKRLLGGGLPGKRAVQRMLAKDNGLAGYLPSTATLRSVKGLAALLDRHCELFLKPDSGSQGRGVFRVGVEPGSGAVTVRGRTSGNEPFTRRFVQYPDFADWLQQVVGTRPYLIQPYLPLCDSAGTAYDIRCLVQKDGSGRWHRTGIAVRRGLQGSVTANLHGGGTAEPAEPFLAREFGCDTAASMIETLRRLAERVPAVLEARQGRLVELGIDFGVDRNGRVWLIEVNSKPGRASFAHIASPETRQAAVENPLRYARSLLLAPSRRTLFSPNAYYASQTL